MPVDTPLLEPQTAEYELIKNNLPGWLTQAGAPTREAFKRSSLGGIDWVASLGDSERQQLQHYNDTSAQSQNAVDQAMADLQSAEAFAEPLLAEAIRQQFNIAPDLNATFLDVRKPIELGVQGTRIGSFSVLNLSLLQAALHNFEASECLPGAFSSRSRFKAGRDEQATTLTLGMGVEAFLGLCRSLDIGAKYQAYLTQFFHTAQGLRDTLIKAQKDALQAAAYVALLKGDIGSDDYRVMQAVIADQREIRADGKPVWFNDLSLMGLRLSGCTVFVAVEKNQSTRAVLVYIPHDPEHPLKKYATHQELEAELTRQLMADVKDAPAGSGPGRYQRFLANYLAYADQPTYWRRLTEDAPDQPHDPHLLLRISQYVLPFFSSVVSVFLSPNELPANQNVREPIKDPDFHIRVLAKGDLWQENVDLWADNFERLRDKLIADARGHAVPTAEVDARVRARKIAALESAGLLALNLVSMFVPGLGEVMMGVMAAQLLYETFEGVVEWHDGDREAAFAHLTDVAQNLVFIGAMAVGGVGLRRVLGTPPLIEGLKPVTLPNGKQKLWKADLTPYKVPAQLAPQAQPDALGLYAHEGQTVLPLEGDCFEVRHDPATDEHRIQHPTRPNAYAPLLEHNHEGAWQHEAEDPLTWDGPTVLRRLGQPAQGLSAERLQQAQRACGVEADALRAGHLDQEPIPLALADTLQRFKIADQLADFISQLKSPDPAQYAQADPALQMDLLRRRGMLPDAAMAVYEANGTALWTEPTLPSQARRALVLPEGALARGELLQELLAFLGDDDPALQEFPGHASDALPERARLLRQYLGEQAQASESALVQERYQAQTRSADLDVRLMQSHYPGLPSAMAEHVLKNLDTRQLLGFRANGQLAPSVTQQLHWQLQELRVTRAREGLYCASLANEDSALLNAQAATLPREATRAVLLEHPLHKPAYDASMRLLGGGRGIRQWANTTANALRTPSARVRRLFPSYTDEQVESFITSLGTDVRRRLSSLESEYTTLKRVLKTWVRDNAPAVSTTAFDRQGGFVKTYANAIKRCWRRETHSLTIAPGHPLNLPELTADFSHVESLDLVNTPWTPAAQTFLNNFKRLQRLRISDAALGELPEGLGDMAGLTQLRLRGNRIRLTPQSVEELGRLSQLEVLDLAQNPLELAPDFSTMAHLKYVFLNGTGLEHWPAGLREQADLQELNLRDNHLRSIPLEHLEPAPEHFEKVIKLNQAISLMGNRLSAEAEVALDNYWRRVAKVHPEMMSNGRGDRFSVESPSIAQVRSMYPNHDIGQCREFIWSLGAGGEAELGRLTREYQGLKAQLDAWVFSGGGARQRYMRMDQVLQNVAERDDRNMARTRILACWRQETPQRFAADGAPIGMELDLSGLTLPSLPDLDADFSHVGSLKLKGMSLSASPEGFLARFREVRWLDMSNNQLRELPPALGDMHGLTKLFLDNNQIRLTPDSARVLAQRTTLRALWMSRNPLGRVPDFSLIPDMRSVNLDGTDIDHWPEGLGQQPLLDKISLRNNQLSTLPDFLIAPADPQLASSFHVGTHINVSNNPFSEATLQQLRAYAMRLREAGLVEEGRPQMLIATALGMRSPIIVRTLGTPFERWTQGFSQEQIATRTRQWMTLRDDPGSDGFFQMLNDMETSTAAYEDQQRRVWDVIDSITEPNPESAALREEMFTWAGRAACCDRAALSFSNLQIMQMVYRAKAAATETTQGAALLQLARGLFRLDEVEKTALVDIAQRTEAINNDPDLSLAQKQSRIQQLEEVEVRLAYRYGLRGAQQLDLPGQSDQARFIAMGEVSQPMLDATRARILGLNNSPEEFQSLLSREFWKDYVAHKYRPQFEAQSKPYHEQLAALLEQVDAGQLPRDAYDTQAQALQSQLGIAEAGLIENLTRTELEEYPLPGPPENRADNEVR